jgi:hypothetical protein
MVYVVMVYVVSKTLTQHSLIVATYFLNTVEVNIKEGDNSIRKINILLHINQRL